MARKEEIKKGIAIEDSIKLKFLMLSKFTKQMVDPVKVSTPVFLIDQPRFRNFKKANIIKIDHERNQIIDYMISNLYRVYLLLFDKSW